MTAAQPDLFGEFDALAADLEQQREFRAAWSARFDRVKVTIAYQSAGGDNPGDVLDGIVCPSCGGIEFNDYLLSINHGWDPGVPGYGPFESRCNKQRHLDAGRTDISLDRMGVVRITPPAVERDATLSADGRYRYSLTRDWDDSCPTVAWIMLNPSTADADVDDPTIRRCIQFSKDWGYGGLIVVNLFALRATDPKALNTFAPNDPIGPVNDNHLYTAVHNRTTIAAWGASVPPYWRHRPAGVIAQLRQRDVALHHLGLTKDGHPRHPLYLRGDTRPTLWTAS